MDIAPDAPEDAAVDITLMKGNQSKTFAFEGTTGAESVTVQVLNDRDARGCEGPAPAGRQPSAPGLPG